MYPPRFVPEILRKKKNKIPKVCPKLKTTQNPTKTDSKYLLKADKETKRIPNICQKSNVILDFTDNHKAKFCQRIDKHLPKK